MHVLMGIALKSLLIAGLTLGLLQLLNKRSAAERSWVAHVGLLALVIMAFAPLVLPTWNIEAPALFGRAPDTPAAIQNVPAVRVPKAFEARPASTLAATTAQALPMRSFAAAATALYAIPAAILLFITMLALIRLLALRARADVLVDGHWLSALARAQRRMGFKHGTALLTSDDLASPISWGLLRPVILLNSSAVEAAGEAEAIIAHELAHVARMDWIKLLLARVATALFWFNPLVWMLAREAHQLREEAADDSVLAADIADTDYAELLVGVARHECPGLLLGAHGVAPSKNSLARRVARVLDGKSVRGPAAWPFAVGVFVGAALVAAPLAALTLTPAKTVEDKQSTTDAKNSPNRSGSNANPGAMPADIPHILADGVSTSVAAAVSAVSPAEEETRINAETAAAVRSEIRRTSIEQARAAIEQARAASQQAYAASRNTSAARAVGVTPEYVGAMRAATRSLANVQMQDLTEMRAVGVTPDFARGLATAGFPSLTPGQLVEARAIGLDGSYVRSMRAAGVEGAFEDFIQLRAVGIDPMFAAQARKPGVGSIRANELMELYAVGGANPP